MVGGKCGKDLNRDFIVNLDMRPLQLSNWQVFEVTFISLFICYLFCLCMCMCVCVYICMGLSVCTCLNICVFIHVYIWAVFVHVCMSVCVHTCVYMCSCHIMSLEVRNNLLLIMQDWSLNSGLQIWCQFLLRVDSMPTIVILRVLNSTPPSFSLSLFH